MRPENYFDHAATTPLDPRVLEAMLPYLRNEFGNAHSLHQYGLHAADAVDRARESVAELIGAEGAEEIVFTSGSTEACNWVIRNFQRVAISPFEHSAVREPGVDQGATVLEANGYRLSSPPSPVDLIAVMTVNNETGAILSPPEAQPDVKVFRDITQQAGKLPIGDEDLGDYAALSAHKFYGPKGIGALYIRDMEPLDPFIRGGEQEMGRRGGTLNVPAIVGMGKAAEIAMEESARDREHASRLRTIVLSEIETLEDIQINAQEGFQSPYILSISVRGVQGETLVMEMDAAGYAISSGSACSSRSNEPSHVLTSLDVLPDYLRGTIRLSFGRANTESSAKGLARKLCESICALRRLSNG